MIDRRSVLRRSAGALGAATLASTAGCAFLEAGSNDTGTDEDDDGGFLATLPDPRPHVAPSFHAAYSYDPLALRNDLGADPMPDLAGELLAIVGEMDGTVVADVDRLVGQDVHQVGYTGDLSFPSPTGTDLVVEGSIDVEGAANWLASQDQLSDLGDAQGYRRFGNGGQVVEAFTASDATLTFGNRRVTEIDASALADATIDGLDDGFDVDDYPSPNLHATVSALTNATADDLPEATATVATAFDLVAERPDTGTDAYDATAASLLAAGIAADVGGETTTVTRVLHYRQDRAAAVDGERTTETWTGSVSSGDRFETESTPSPGTTLDLVWASGTANETILLRLGVPG